MPKKLHFSFLASPQLSLSPSSGDVPKEADSWIEQIVRLKMNSGIGLGMRLKGRKGLQTRTIKKRRSV